MKGVCAAASLVVCLAIASVRIVSGDTLTVSSPDLILTVASTAVGTVPISVQILNGQLPSLAVKVDGTTIGMCKSDPLVICSMNWNTTTWANGTHTVAVGSGQKVFASAAVTVSNTVPPITAAPVLAALAPSTVAAGSSAFTLTLNGSGFLAGAVIRWNGSARSTTVVSPTQLTTPISSGDIALAGVATITAVNPGSPASNSLSFTVSAPTSTPPLLTAITPSTVTANSGAFTLTVNGSGFASSAAILWNGSPRPTTYVSGSQLTATVASGDVAVAGTASVTATNAGTAASNALPLTITAAGGPVSNFNVYQVPAVPRPALRQPFTDPVFGTTINRITDPSMGSTLGYRHEYARLTGFNADATKVVAIRMSGYDFQVMDVASGAVLRTVPTCSNDPSVTWSRMDPDRLMYFCGNAVKLFSVALGTATTVMTVPYSSVGTGEEGAFSDDGQYAAVFGYDSSGNKKEVLVLDLVTKSIVTRSTALAFGDWVGMSPSGQYVVIQHDDTSHGTRVYDRGLNYLRTLHPDGTHEDFAIDSDGEEVMVWYSWSDAQALQFGDRSVVAKARLRDGQTTVLADTRWLWGGHVSGIGSRGRPGWVLLSDYKTTSDPATNSSPFQREIFWLKMDGSGAVERLAHHHSEQGSCNGDKDYFAEPHAVASFDGRLVLFASIWGAAPCTRYDTYIIGR